jgi:transposase InsO family protein
VSRESGAIHCRDRGAVRRRGRPEPRPCRRSARRPGRPVRRRRSGRRLCRRGGRGTRRSSVELRHDHGSQYLTDYFQGQSRYHGFTPSFAFIGEPETNGVVERFNRTLKEQIIHGKTYRNRAELAAAVTAFVTTYNREWRLEKLRYQSPLEARRSFQPPSLLAA